jgi:GT2 family glycosyltransferase
MVRDKYPRVHLIANAQNMGFAKGSNQGIRAAGGRYVLLLNPDTVVVDRSIERLVEFLETHPEIGACGGRLFYPNGEYQRSAHPLPTAVSGLYEYSALFTRVPLLARLLVSGWIDRPEETHAIGYSSAACLLVSRACLDDTGLIDEAFFLYGDDVDWCRRMWEAGWPVYYLAESHIIHHEGGSQGHQFGRRLREMRGELQYLRKWHGSAYTRLYQTIVWLCSLYRYLKFRLFQVLRPHETEKFSQYAAFYRAILLGSQDFQASSKRQPSAART